MPRPLVVGARHVFSTRTEFGADGTPLGLRPAAAPVFCAASARVPFVLRLTVRWIRVGQFLKPSGLGISRRDH